MSTILENAFEGLGEKAFYERFCQKEQWSIYEFVALAARLIPKDYLAQKNSSSEISESVYQKRLTSDLECPDFLKKFYTDSNGLYTNSCQYVKWLAEKEIGVKVAFLRSLPLRLLELFIAFQPTNIALRTAPRESREYHKAYYLKSAEELRDQNPALSYTQIYDHPKMQNTMRYMREFGAQFKKRTVVESWLPKYFGKLQRGRPKKVD